ncbi:MAG: protein translocase subunit SecF [Candidatus Uhrbacteria bacterium]|nr:protein translocase subunit SecF [Candidatus Uhrbacteria bacterium]
MKFSVIKLRPLWYAFSGVLLAASLFAVASYGLKQGIEFTGGSLMAVRFEQRPSVAEAGATVTNAVPDLGAIIVQPAGESDMQFRLKALSEDEHQAVLIALRETHGEITELRFDAIGPVIGVELRRKSMQGLLVVALAIMAYVAWAFRRVSAPVPSWQYGAVTLLAALHDVIVPVGVFAALGHFYGVEIGTAFISAILTILGYSITDTIVVLDRIRENLLKTDLSFPELVDKAVRSTFLRSFNTSVTTLLALVAILLFGGSSLREFTLTLIIGIAVGTYSSIFIASPLLVSFEKWQRKRK